MTVPVLMLLLGLYFAGSWARETLRVEGNADVVFGLFFDGSAAEGDGVLQLWNRGVVLLDVSLLSS